MVTGRGPIFHVSPLLITTFSVLHMAPTENDDVDFVYPPHILTNPSPTILAPRNRQIDTYNPIVLDGIVGDHRTYRAADSEESHRLQPLQPKRHPPPRIPHRTTIIKTNAVYRFLLNFSLNRGLVKNARLCVVDDDSTSASA
jgi:hypothetical protein